MFSGTAQFDFGSQTTFALKFHVETAFHNQILHEGLGTDHKVRTDQHPLEPSSRQSTRFLPTTVIACGIPGSRSAATATGYHCRCQSNSDLVGSTFSFRCVVEPAGTASSKGLDMTAKGQSKGRGLCCCLQKPQPSLKASRFPASGNFRKNLLIVR